MPDETVSGMIAYDFFSYRLPVFIIRKNAFVQQNSFCPSGFENHRNINTANVDKLN